jgi:hypothetical protein
MRVCQTNLACLKETIIALKLKESGRGRVPLR